MSIRTRLILTHISVILITLTIVAVGLIVILRTYQRDIQLARLGDAVVPLAFQARAMLQNDVPPKEIMMRLEQQATGVGNVIVINEKGLVLADAAYGLTNRNIGVAALQKPGAQRGFVWGVFQQNNLNRNLLYVAVASGQLNGQNVYVGLAARERGLLTVLGDIGMNLLVAGVITLIVSLVAALLLARSIARPITRLTQATEAIARGQYEHRVDTKGSDEIGRLAESFNSMAEQVQRSRQMEKDFVADVSHELKTPLTSIQGFSQAIVDGAVQDLASARRAAQTIFDEAGRMAALVADLLTLARLESKQMSLAQDQVNLTELLPGWIERLRPRANNCGETLSMEINPLPAIIGDAGKLEQVVVNLVENAIKYNRPEGTVTVVAKTQAIDNTGKNPLITRRRNASVPAQQWIRISVQDTGEGIAAEELPRLFNRFYRGDKARVAGGTGLGLSIAKEIVEAHGGTITVTSEVNRGSSFTINLPVR
ncbi:MAG: HAMP domain-containing protein [Chloroflexi bacterium]|nr:HAMP domain-containing protein [Chloroflexota bacterium]